QRPVAVVVELAGPPKARPRSDVVPPEVPEHDEEAVDALEQAPFDAHGEDHPGERGEVAGAQRLQTGLDLRRVTLEFLEHRLCRTHDDPGVPKCAVARERERLALR